MSKEIDPVYFTNHVNKKLRPSDDLQGEASVHGLSVASNVQIGTADAALKLFRLDSTGNIKTSNSLVFKGETGATSNLVKVEGGLSVESGSGLFVRAQQGIRVIGDDSSDTLIDLTRFTNSERAVVNFIPSGSLSSANVKFSIGFDYGSTGFSLLSYNGTSTTDYLNVSAAGLVTIKSGTTISGNAAISGTLTQRGNATFLGDTNVSGNSFVSGNSNVSGLSTLNTVNVTGDFLASGLTVKNNVSITGTLSVTGLTTLESLVIRGSSTLDGDFGVLGDTTLNTLDVTGSFANVSGSATFNTLNVTGSSFSASGASTVNTLTATGTSVNVQQNLNVSGASVVNTLVASGATIGLSGALTQRGSASFLSNVSISGNTTISGNTFVSGIISGSNLLKETNGPFFFKILDGYINANPSAYHFVTRPELNSFGNVPESYTVFSIKKDSSTNNGADDKQVNGLYVGLTPNSGTTSRSELMVAVSAQSIASSTATTAFNGNDSFSGISFVALSPKVTARQAGTTGSVIAYGLYIEPQKTGSIVTSGIGIYQASSTDHNYFNGTSYLFSVDNGLRVTGNSSFFTTLTSSNTVSHEIYTTWNLENTISEYSGTILSLYNNPSSITPSFPFAQLTKATGLSIKLAIETGSKNFTNKTVGIYVNALNSSSSDSKFTSSPSANFTGIALLAASPIAANKSGSHTGEIHSYGIYIEPQKSTAIIDEGYGIYQEGINDQNYFAGQTTFEKDVTFNSGIYAKNGFFDTLISGSALNVEFSSYLSTDSSALLGIGLPFGSVLEGPVDVALGTVFRDNIKVSGNVSLALVTGSQVGINTITPVSGLSVNTDAVFHSGVTVSGSTHLIDDVFFHNNFETYSFNEPSSDPLSYVGEEFQFTINKNKKNHLFLSPNATNAYPTFESNVNYKFPNYYSNTIFLPSYDDVLNGTEYNLFLEQSSYNFTINGKQFFKFYNISAPVATYITGNYIEMPSSTEAYPDNIPWDAQSAPLDHSSVGVYPALSVGKSLKIFKWLKCVLIGNTWYLSD